MKVHESFHLSRLLVFNHACRKINKKVCYCASSRNLLKNKSDTPISHLLSSNYLSFQFNKLQVRHFNFITTIWNIQFSFTLHK